MGLDEKLKRERERERERDCRLKVNEVRKGAGFGHSRRKGTVGGLKVTRRKRGWWRLCHGGTFAGQTHGDSTIASFSINNQV